MNWRSHPNWDIALRLLKSVRPGSTGYDPDDVAGIVPADWAVFQTEGPDVTVGEELLGRVASQLSGVVVVVTFASYLRLAGPFFVASSQLFSLISEHAEAFDDPFFSGDVTMVAPKTGTVVLVHHDGLLAVLSGEPSLAFDDDAISSQES